MAKLRKILIPITTQDVYDPIGLFVLKVFDFRLGGRAPLYVLYLLIIVTVLKFVLNF